MKRMLCLLLCLLLTLLCGCRGSGDADQIPSAVEPSLPAPTEPQPTDFTPDTGAGSGGVTLTELSGPQSGFSDFDAALIEYLQKNGWGDKSFTVSPLSFKAALALAAEGAAGQTQEELLSALGFDSLAALERWYESVLQGVDSFAAFSKGYGVSEPGDAAYRVVNSVWRNSDMRGSLRPSYQERVQSSFRAEAAEAPGAALAGRVNGWIDEQTEGMIPAVADDLSDVTAVLVNAVYLRTAWERPFSELGERLFTTASGARVRKDFLGRTGEWRYYEDESCQLVELRLQGGVQLVLVLGDGSELSRKLSEASYELVEVWLPKFEVESSFDHEELVDFLRAQECRQMFTWAADFDPMFTESVYVSDILQKARVHLDEDGMEAAAATVIETAPTSAEDPEQPPEPKLFHADRPFAFYLCRQDAGRELLFYGQILD